VQGERTHQCFVAQRREVVGDVRQRRRKRPAEFGELRRRQRRRNRRGVPLEPLMKLRFGRGNGGFAGPQRVVQIEGDCGWPPGRLGGAALPTRLGAVACRMLRNQGSLAGEVGEVAIVENRLARDCTCASPEPRCLDSAHPTLRPQGLASSHR
jgi:hypothetical protein